jgi:hypothetical protein
LTVTLAICLLVSAIVTRGASAQSIATLNGTVKDSSGAFIPRAQVTLTNPSTGVAQTKETNETGLYSFMNVLPGSYTLLVTREGFTPELQPRFTLEVNQTATVNFVMQVGLTRTEVQVSAQAIQLESSFERTQLFRVAFANSGRQPR